LCYKQSKKRRYLSMKRIIDRLRSIILFIVQTFCSGLYRAGFVLVT
jgi:hypothetical protein